MAKVTAGATGALGNLTFTGSDGVAYDPTSDNFSSSATASQGVIFLGSDNVTGTYSSMWDGLTPSGGCIGSGAVSIYSAILPTGTASFKLQKTFTSSTSFTEKYSYYSDPSCSTSTGYIKFGYTNIIVNPAAVSFNTTISPRPSSAYQVQYSKLNVISKGKTSTAVSFLNTFVGMTHSLDVEQTKPDSGTIYNIWATGTAGGVNLLFIGTEDETYP